MSDDIGRIRKLLVMAEKGTPHEREVAAEKAREMLARNGLAERDCALVEREVLRGRRIIRARVLLLDVVAESCGCLTTVTACGGEKTVTLIGDETGVAVAAELFAYLENEIRRRAADCGVKTRRGRFVFAFGAVERIGERLRSSGGWRDMSVRRRRVLERYFSGRPHKALRVKVRGTSAQYDAGLRAGGDISLSRQAAGSAPRGILTKSGG